MTPDQFADAIQPLFDAKLRSTPDSLNTHYDKCKHLQLVDLTAVVNRITDARERGSFPTPGGLACLMKQQQDKRRQMFDIDPVNDGPLKEQIQAEMDWFKIYGFPAHETAYGSRGWKAPTAEDCEYQGTMPKVEIKRV